VGEAGRKGGRQGIRVSLHRLRQGAYAVTSHSSQGQTADQVLTHVDTELGAKDLLNNRMAYVASRAAHTARKWTVNTVSPQLPEQSAQGLSGLPALRIRPLFCFLTRSMVTRSDDIEQSSKMIEGCSHCVRKSTGALRKGLRPSHLSNTATSVILMLHVRSRPCSASTNPRSLHS
jgi:hypothetical protein